MSKDLPTFPARTVLSTRLYSPIRRSPIIAHRVTSHRFRSHLSRHYLIAINVYFMIYILSNPYANIILPIWFLATSRCVLRPYVLLPFLLCLVPLQTTAHNAASACDFLLVSSPLRLSIEHFAYSFISMSDHLLIFSSCLSHLALSLFAVRLFRTSCFRYLRRIDG